MKDCLKNHLGNNRDSFYWTTDLATVPWRMLLGWISPLQADDSVPRFVLGINLNGPAVVIDGQQWHGADSPHYICHDKAFENQAVKLVPATDPARAKMIRSSRWGGSY